jgi:hypothetical protein
MAKNIHPKAGKDYVIITPENYVASFTVTHVGPKVVYVEWGEVGRNKGWISDFNYNDKSKVTFDKDQFDSPAVEKISCKSRSHLLVIILKHGFEFTHE